MRKFLLQIVCLLLPMLLFGCKGMFGPQGIPDDPLFANGKPAESKAKAGPPVAPPFSEPTPPVNRTQFVQY